MNFAEFWEFGRLGVGWPAVHELQSLFLPGNGVDPMFAALALQLVVFGAIGFLPVSNSLLVACLAMGSNISF